jgi:hypothetical protein
MQPRILRSPWPGTVIYGEFRRSFRQTLLARPARHARTCDLPQLEGALRRTLSGPLPGSGRERIGHQGQPAGQARAPAMGGWAGGEPRRWWAAARPAALALGTHGAGRRRSAVPPHPPPAGPRRHAPQLTAPAKAAGPSSRAGRSCRRESPLSRALRPAAFASLRFAPLTPLTATFPGKIRHLPGGWGGNTVRYSHATAMNGALPGPLVTAVAFGGSGRRSAYAGPWSLT